MYVSLHLTPLYDVSLSMLPSDRVIWIICNKHLVPLEVFEKCFKRGALPLETGRPFLPAIHLPDAAGVLKISPINITQTQKSVPFQLRSTAEELSQGTSRFK